MHTQIKHVLARKGYEVHGVPSNVPISEAARKMAELKIGSVVVRSEGQVVGILTERDLAWRVCLGELDPAVTPVEQVMTSPVAYVTPETTVAEAMKVMSETRCRHLPVLADEELMGVISLGDLVRWLTADLEENIRYLEGYILRA